MWVSFKLRLLQYYELDIYYINVCTMHASWIFVYIYKHAYVNLFIKKPQIFILSSITKLRNTFGKPKRNISRDYFPVSYIYFPLSGISLCLHAELQEWFPSHSININGLPLFQYTVDCLFLNMKKLEIIEKSELTPSNWITKCIGHPHNISC